MITSWGEKIKNKINEKTSYKEQKRSENLIIQNPSGILTSNK